MVRNSDNKYTKCTGMGIFLEKFFCVEQLVKYLYILYIHFVKCCVRKSITVYSVSGVCSILLWDTLV